MSDPTTLGYWYRYGPTRRTLHVAKWQRTESGSLIIVSACGQQVIEPTAPEVPAGLSIPPTARIALDAIQPEQARVLCSRCTARLTPRRAA